MTTVSVPSPVRVTTGELPALVGRVLGHSAWHTVTQADANTFGAATGDMQWIHTDPARAAHGPYGQTIAHGYLTLSITNMFLPQLVTVSTSKLGINYGANKVRFPAPVPVNSRIRVGGEVLEADDIPGGVQMIVRLTVEVEGSEKPACVVESVTRWMF